MAQVGWFRLVEWPELAARLPALVSSAVYDRSTGWKRAFIENNLHDVWLLVTENPQYALDGFANFRPGSAALGRPPELTHVWMRRSARRQGHLRAIWPTWRELYGDFRVSAPNDAMSAALEHIEE